MRTFLFLALFLPLLAWASPPCGRLTLVSGQPIVHGDLVSGTVYYTPYICGTVPAWSGAAWVDVPLGEISVSLAGTTAGEIRDVFYSAGSLELGAPWTSDTQRSVTVYQSSGTWTNANWQTYLGTVLITENGQTRLQTKPAPVSYGANNVLGLWNAYNRIRVLAVNRNLNTSWSYASEGLRFANNSAQFSITWIDGLGQSISSCRYVSNVAGLSTKPAAATVGCGLDQYSYPINWNGFLSQAALESTHVGMIGEGSDMTVLIGKHRWNAMEQSTDVPILFYGNNFSALSVELEM